MKSTKKKIKLYTKNHQMTNIIMMAPSQTIIKPKILKKTGPDSFSKKKIRIINGMIYYHRNEL